MTKANNHLCAGNAIVRRSQTDDECDYDDDDYMLVMKIMRIFQRYSDDDDDEDYHHGAGSVANKFRPRL